MEINFKSIAYLQKGTPIQRQLYEVLLTHGIMTRLQEFTPVLVGTFPLDISIENSDVDIACFCETIEGIQAVVQRNFSRWTSFSDAVFDLRGQLSYVANFQVDGWEIELFAQTIPVDQQYGYRHLLIEHALLVKNGQMFKEKVVELKRQGLKTEPAFAQLLGLTGDPYEELLTCDFQKT